MKISYKEINGVYAIKMKIIEPESDVRGFIIGVHGFGGDMESSVIAGLAERMTEHGFAVVAFNFPGHGTSNADGYFNVSRCRLDLQTVFEFAQRKYENIQTKAIFATSFGGYITLLSINNFPDNTKIILRAPAVNMSEVFERVVSEVIPVEEYLKKGSITLGFERKTEVSADFYRELKTNSVFTSTINRPMLVIHGDCDNLVLPEEIKCFCERNPQAQLKIIKGADHRFKENGALKQIIDCTEKYLLG